MKKLSTEEFIKMAKLLNGDNFDYSLINYINTRTKIKIICNKSHIFEQLPSIHLKGVGCYECYNNLKIEKLKKLYYKIHGNNYNIISDVYKNAKTKIEIKHEKCGNIFESNYHNIYDGLGCPYCSDKKKLSIDILKERCFNLHKNDYSILSTEYINNSTKILVKHNKCKNEFFIKPNHFSNGSGCPNCYKSKGENKIKLFLETNNITYLPQYSFDGCKYKQPLNFDFYLPELNICIEYDGRQHYEPVEKFGGIDEFELTKIRDSIKNSYCKDKNIKLIRIPYSSLNKIDEVLDDHLIM